MNIRLNFWRDPSRWPRDTASHVFLARAAHEMGKALFRADWTGGEPCVELMQSIPVEGSSRRQHSVKKLWAEIHSTIAQDRKDKGPALERFSKVQEQIIQFAEAEKLIAALRPIAGGDPVTVPRSWWNSERLSVRFDYCQMNPKKPFDIGIAGDDYQWIFVTRVSLVDCLSLVKTSLETVTGGEPAAILGPAAKDKLLPISVKVRNETFKQWRESRGDDIPSEREDVAYMKRLGVGRDAVRELRRNAPKLSRGRRPGQTSK
jgi:hypothetical protein